MKKIYLTLLLLMIPQTFAVEIHQILYDPTSTETGGEAIELYNNEDYDISLDGWTISTSVSDQDVTFPKNATINAKSYFLVADIGWKATKDAEWRNADYEETITLPNTDSGIALKNKNGTIIDAVGWGDATKIKTGLFNGSPAKLVKEGYTLIRVSNTGNNLNDFVEQPAEFNDGQSVLITVDVGEVQQKINRINIIQDDSNNSGVQIKPIAGKTRNITLIANIDGANPFVDFDDKIIAMSRANNSIYVATIPLDYYLAPGNHTIKTFAGETMSATTFEYLPLKKFEVHPQSVQFKTTKGTNTKGIEQLTLKNLGNVPVSISFTFADLKNKNNTINAQNLYASIDSSIARKVRETTITLMPGSRKEIILSLDTPAEIAIGNYTSLLKVFGD